MESDALVLFHNFLQPLFSAHIIAELDLQGRDLIGDFRVASFLIGISYSFQGRIIIGIRRLASAVSIIIYTGTSFTGCADNQVAAITSSIENIDLLIFMFKI